MCLWCNETGRTFYSMEAARAHMVDKGHCKMLHEGLALAEYADYYDYRYCKFYYQLRDDENMIIHYCIILYKILNHNDCIP